MTDKDVFIIGTGTAGQTVAYDLVAEGYDVTIVDKTDRPGGVCAQFGCQAKKWFYELTETVARCQHMKGIGITSSPSFNWADAREAKDTFTSAVPQNTVTNLKGNGITYVKAEAFFADADTVIINDTPYRPRYTIIATGAKPMSLPITGNEHLITSTDFLNLKRLPQRVTFIGGGFISFEFAHFAARLGSSPEDVHIVEVMDRPLGPFDSDMVAQLLAATQAEGIQIHVGNAVHSIERNGSEFVVSLESGTTIDTDLVVHGAGRVPDIDTLNLDAAGIASSRKGIIVNQQMKTSNAKVYAVGDCAATVQLARVADYEAHIAAAAVIAQDTNEGPPSLNYRAVPALLFTYPQLGMVGKTEDELIRDGVKYWKSFDTQISWPTYKRIGMKHAAYKILVDDQSKILGAHILSDNAAGLINTFKQAMLDDKNVEDLYQDNIMSPYPSRESDIIYMLDSLRD